MSRSYTGNFGNRPNNGSYFSAKRRSGGVVGCFEEEAVYSYTEYLAGVDNGTYTNAAAPKIAIEYWKLSPDARLRDVIILIRADEARYRDINRRFADALV